MSGFRRGDEEEAIQVSKLNARCMKSWRDCSCLCMGMNSTWSFCYDSAALGKDAASGTSRSSKYE